MLRSFKIYFLLFFLVSQSLGCLPSDPPSPPPRPPLKIKEVIRCNRFGTCAVQFENGELGLMTRPKVGEWGCKVGAFGYNRCEPSKENKDVD